MATRSRAVPLVILLGGAVSEIVAHQAGPRAVAVALGLPPTACPSLAARWMMTGSHLFVLACLVWLVAVLVRRRWGVSWVAVHFAVAGAVLGVVALGVVIRLPGVWMFLRTLPKNEPEFAEIVYLVWVWAIEPAFAAFGAMCGLLCGRRGPTTR